jgi:hypothetical protein
MPSEWFPAEPHVYVVAVSLRCTLIFDNNPAAFPFSNNSIQD